MNRKEFLAVGCRCGIGAMMALLVPAAVQAKDPDYDGNQTQKPDVPPLGSTTGS